MGPTSIDTVLVAVPARNEADSIERCLTSIDEAADCVGRRVIIVAAMDSCHDDTAVVARLTGALMRSELIVLEGAWRAAGRARAAAVGAGLELADAEPSTTWIANTDADCVVPQDWLARHLDHARLGAHAVTGVVELDPTMTTPSLLAQFNDAYRIDGATHRHVHGANLGIRADAYQAVGGWGLHVMIGEDHELIRRLTNAGLTVARTADTVVVTSSRTVGRIPAGFANHLTRLDPTAFSRNADTAALAGHA